MAATEITAWAVAQGLALIQAAPVHWTAVVTAISVASLALMGVGVAVGILLTLRSLNRGFRSLQRRIEALAPRTEPILERANRIMDDASAISRTVRDDVHRVHRTVEDVDRRLRAAAESTEERVRRIAAVLDVVQDETERVLLDATATARGLQVTARALQRRSRRDGGRSRAQPETAEDRETEL